MIVPSTKGTVNFGRELFWDIPESAIEAAVKNSPGWVINRVFEYGTLKEIADVIEFYGQEKASAFIKQTSVKPMARAMAFLFLNIELPKIEERPLLYK